MILEILELTAAFIQCFLTERFLTGFLGFKSQSHRIKKTMPGILMIFACKFLLPQIIKSEPAEMILIAVIYFAYSAGFLKGNLRLKIFAVLLGNMPVLIINSLVRIGLAALSDLNFVPYDAVKSIMLLSANALYFLGTQTMLRVCKEQDCSQNKIRYGAAITMFLTTLKGALTVFELKINSRYAGAAILSGYVLINISAYFF